MDSYTIGSSAIVLFVTVLTVGHFGSGKPIENLGVRPMGKNLWEWLNDYYQKKGEVGCWGYDPILGAWPPLIRGLFHISFWMMMWSVGLLLLPSMPAFTFIITIAIYSYSLNYINHELPSVSDPGGPREHKIKREPKWDDTVTQLFEGIPSWRCAVAQDSHQVTKQRFQMEDDGNEDEDQTTSFLTGEPAGRQIWTTKKDPSVTKEEVTPSPVTADISVSKRGFFGFGTSTRSALAPAPGREPTTPEETKTEDMVQSMALGGREPGFNPSKNPNSCDMIFRAQQIRNYIKMGLTPPSTSTKPTTAREAAKKGAHFYSMLQTEDGHFAGDYGGPNFLMPGLIVAWYIMGCPDLMLDGEQRKLMKHYIAVHQQTDGGWGTHIESPSTMFGTVMMYTALRLLGTPKDDPVCIKGRAFIQENGGALMTASWNKLYLCLLGCMDWDAHNSVPPEMWLLPNWFPLHPGRMWCHCRMVYLPMGYLYGARFVYAKAETDPLIQSLREELYCEPYESIPWMKTRHMVAPMDNYSRIPVVMKVVQDALARYETWPILQPIKDYIRSFGLKFCLDYMNAEDLQTNYIDIGPVNKVLNMISAFHASGSDLSCPAVVKHMMRVPDYLWVAEDGMKMQGYNGSQCWDTSFAIQAFSEAGLLDDFPEVSKKVWKYLERTQILSTEVSQASPAFKFETNEYRSKFYRHVSQGGWPFSSSAHGWPIADCTGEGLKGVLCLTKSKTIKIGLADSSLRAITDDRLENAVNVLLTYQNEDMGWATYENNRGFRWYELLNPSEVFGDIMIDYSYVELSMASMTALMEFQEIYPDHRKEEVTHAIRKGQDFIKSIQRPDGSWYGSWACCFTYGCWFGIEGLIASGESPISPAIQKACSYLLSQQRENGGWGEDFTSCYDKEYAKDGMKAYGVGGSGVVNTSWALLGLAAAKYDDIEPIKRGVKFLIDQQLPSGDWPQQGISGVFNRACGITYTSYRNVFPIWALGRCAETYGDALEEH